MLIGGHEFDLLHKSYIMGILNTTPDSFSDGGRFIRIDDALKQAGRMIEEGASIIDVGGESTRPGYAAVSADEELSRVLPVIEALKKHFDIPVSLDTWKHQVAEKGIEAGADMINDIWGLRRDEGQMAHLISRTNVPCCLTHNRVRADYSEEGNFLTGFQKDIDEILSLADEAGISRDQIILDPGIGFGKTFDHNLFLLKNLSVMSGWGLPVLLGVSRKSVIGNALKLPVEEREEGTMVSTVIGRLAGVSIFRVHDVKKNIRALRMTEAISSAGL